jgi:tetratricopeptide (TPR) repeat protein
VHKETDPGLPGSVWDGRTYTSIHAVVLYADVEDGALIANTLSSAQYDEFVDAYQGAMAELVTSLREQQMPIAEVQLSGGCCQIIFYDESEVHRNYLLDGPNPVKDAERHLLIKESRASNQNIVISALRAAIQVKNTWLVQEFNIARVRSHLAPWGLGIGMHYGRVYLRNRVFGKRRVEGYPLHWAKHIQSLSPEGSYSHIFLSRRTRDLLLNAVLTHTQLSQRVFFNEKQHPCLADPTTAQVNAVYELRYYHRIGVHVSQEAIYWYDALFKLDPANTWAYYQLVDYYSYVRKDWGRVFELASIMSVANPHDEKALLDQAKYYLQLGKHSQSKAYAEKALSINPALDLAHEHLAVLASETDDIPTQIEHLRQASLLSPRSPVNNFNLGLALLENDDTEEGFFFVQRALSIYPEYKDWQIFRETLLRLKQQGKLPDIYDEYLQIPDSSESAE